MLHALQMGAIGLKIPPGIGVRERVHEQLHVLGPAVIQQEPGAVGVDPAALTQLGQHFQHTGHPIQAQVF